MPSPVGERITRIREARHLSAFALSRLSGVDLVGILKIERGQAHPRTDTLEKLAEALRVSPASFFTDFEIRPDNLSAEEEGLLKGYRDLNPAARKAVHRIFETVKSVFLPANDVAPVWA